MGYFMVVSVLRRSNDRLLDEVEIIWKMVVLAC
jgi:hypothetical protein